MHGGGSYRRASLAIEHRLQPDKGRLKNTIKDSGRKTGSQLRQNTTRCREDIMNLVVNCLLKASTIWDWLLDLIRMVSQQIPILPWQGHLPVGKPPMSSLTFQ